MTLVCSFHLIQSPVTLTKALLLARHKSWQKLRMGKSIHDQYAFLKMLLLAEDRSKKIAAILIVTFDRWRWHEYTVFDFGAVD